MGMNISEKRLEETIEEVLVKGTIEGISEGTVTYLEQPGGYHSRRPEDYDRALCLIPRDVIDFLYATQPKEWEQFKKQHGDEARERLLLRLRHEVETRGTLDVLRKGIRANGCKFKMAFFKPASGLNETLRTLYEGNLFSVVRQLHYSEKNENSLDMVLFLNGLPIFTAELKNPLSGQNVEDAKRQYQYDRDPREPLFAFGRCLAHFAVDPELVYVTTHLQGPKTRFLPFNQGNGTGAGNPPSWKGYATAYLWERIWSRDSVLNLIQHFIHEIELEDDKGRKTGERAVIFPRYHQLDAVRRLIADARERGPGHRYLIQHSAGSGKSNSIAWLAHQLAGLHGADDRRIFDSIIVITDRRVLDRQLQRTVRQFEQTLGVVENIDQTSRQLKEALEAGKNIIVTTLQKFPVIIGQVRELPGKSFAVIIDEAHSSQSGESSRNVAAVLSAKSLEEAARQEGEAAEEDLEDKIAEEIRKRGFLPNASYFAFTATPKPKTMELFGTPRPDGKFEPFSLYSMRQAIEEGFILDVLANYTTYKSYFSLLKKIEDDPKYDRAKATYLLKQFVELHEHTIHKKVAIMIEHFVNHTMNRIGGKAKAMIVTRSRLHAVRYKLAVDEYLKEKGYNFKALVAFSGTVHDPEDGRDYTEAGMNHFPETQTAEIFKGNEYRIMIVANKFQTGFDQPLLYTMYVDKKLGGVNAVQTLSRLNRVHPEKDGTMVLDFANEAEEIQKAFQPYYERTLLSEGTDPNLLYDCLTRLEKHHFYTQDEVEAFAREYFTKRRQDKLYAILAEPVARWEAAAEDEKADFRGKLVDYVRLYAFLSQIITFVDTDLEKFYQFARYYLRKLILEGSSLPVEVKQKVDMESYHIQETSKGAIKLERGTVEIEPQGDKSTKAPPAEDLEHLSLIIEELNKRFGTNFAPEDRVFLQQLEAKLDEDVALKTSVKINSEENAKLTFEHVVNDAVQEMIDTNFKFYKRITDDAEFAKTLLDALFKRYLHRVKAEQD